MGGPRRDTFAHNSTWVTSETSACKTLQEFNSTGAEFQNGIIAHGQEQIQKGRKTQIGKGRRIPTGDWEITPALESLMGMLLCSGKMRARETKEENKNKITNKPKPQEGLVVDTPFCCLANVQAAPPSSVLFLLVTSINSLCATCALTSSSHEQLLEYAVLLSDLELFFFFSDLDFPFLSFSPGSRSLKSLGQVLF